jgi:PEGA domain
VKQPSFVVVRSCALVCALFSLAGCVERKLTVTSEPGGALVYLNNREAGRTPFTTDIGWYGKYDVVVRKDGYETITSRKSINAPWWGYPPFDLFAEMMPWRPRDQHTLNFTMTQTPADASPDALVLRGLDLKRELPATRPSAGSASGN